MSTTIDPRWMQDTNRYICLNCGEMTKRTYIWWANGYGFKKRIFCDVCGEWADLTYVQSKGWARIIVRPGLPF